MAALPKRSKKRLKAAAAGGASAAVTALPLRLADVRASVRDHLNARVFDKLLEASRISLTSIHPDDRAEAGEWLLRLRIHALSQIQPSIYHLTKEDRAELSAALEELASRHRDLHLLPEFDLYISNCGWGLEQVVAAFQRLNTACLAASNTPWILDLRNRALRLMSIADFEEVTPAQRALVASLPDIPAALDEVYERAEQRGSLDEEGRMLLDVLRLDLRLRRAEPWDRPAITAIIRAMPSPNAEECAAVRAGQPRMHCLTPSVWAFLCDLQYSTTENLSTLLGQHPEPFFSEAAEALRLIALSLSQEPEAAERLLLQAVELLIQFSCDSAETFGGTLTLSFTDGPRELDIGRSIDIPDIGQLLEGLREAAPVTYPREAEIGALQSIFTARSDFGEAGSSDMPGLEWLCEQSNSFQYSAAAVVDDTAGKIRLLIEALARSAVDKSAPPYAYFPAELAGETIDVDGAVRILDSLSYFAEHRGALSGSADGLWLSQVATIFDALVPLEDLLVRQHTLRLARLFAADLLTQGRVFQLGYLEQVAGDPVAALGHYLAYLESDKASDRSADNIKLLWAKLTDLDVVSRLVAMLKVAAKSAKRAELIRSLLGDAESHHGILSQNDQFERTAVNRWPSMTAQARQLLGVLVSIKTFRNIEELASYAGMDVKWADRHYSKLIDTGMLLMQGSTYRINPHIAPLLERESKHAIIGRIVRTQGTSAVKQVFNSQREFSIYQVIVQLCPNHLVFPNSSLQSIMNYDRMKDLVDQADFGYYLRASVDLVVVSSTTYLPMLAFEVDSVWHDTEKQQERDDRKDRLFAVAGIPFMRLRPVGRPSEATIRVEVAAHVDELVRSLRTDLPGFEQARALLQDIANSTGE